MEIKQKLQEEVENIATHSGALTFDEAQEEEDVVREHPDAEFGR